MKEFERIFWIVLDSVGIGELPAAAIPRCVRACSCPRRHIPRHLEAHRSQRYPERSRKSSRIPSCPGSLSLFQGNFITHRSSAMLGSDSDSRHWPGIKSLPCCDGLRLFLPVHARTFLVVQWYQPLAELFFICARSTR